MRFARTAAYAFTVLLATAGCSHEIAVALKPALHTKPVPHDPDDPAIWVAENDPARSLILATDKEEAQGGLYAFNLDGTVRQVVAPLDRPNNVDVEYGFPLGDTQVDIAVLTERKQRRMRVFAISKEDGRLRDLAPAGLPVLEGQAGEAGEPMGIALYKRPGDGIVFAIVSPKTGGAQSYLWQYRLGWNGSQVTATLVRRFGVFSGIGPTPEDAGEIESVVVDDRLGYVYYSDEQFGIRKWRADPDVPDAGTELAVFGKDGYAGDREGLAIYEHRDGSGYLVSSDQFGGGSRLHVYSREGTSGNPHVHPVVAVIQTVADETDGLDVTSRPLPGFPGGLLVMMNSAQRNFQLYRWENVAAAIDTATELGPRPSAR